ncbi:DEAD/DEAH box helicase [Marinoscillum sp.]|uniref:DEAD/DEAH box helicase n=1 Tax=Marinoscillum sp. TaxID=2024838 RepID=UPI003BABB38E
MKVSPDQPFQIVYSLFEHEYLGFLFESFVIQLNEKGNLTFSHQNISAQNADEFDSGLDANDYELIKTMDQMQQKAVFNHFHKKKLKMDEFFLKVFDKKNENEADKILRDEIDRYLERRRSKVLSLMAGKQLYEMGKDGEPAWKQIHISDEKASILFHFRRNEDNTHYFPTIKLKEEKVHFYQNNSLLLCKEPAWLVVNDTLFTFEKEVNGKKIKPFFNKKFILIPKNVEETYYKKFVAPLIASFDVYAKGFEIKSEALTPTPVLTFSELASASQSTGSLFDSNNDENGEPSVSKILFELSFKYGTYSYKADKLKQVSVSVEKKEDDYVFHRIKRDSAQEKDFIETLNKTGLQLKSSRSTLNKTNAISWLNENLEALKASGFEINQQDESVKKYFLGTTNIDLEISENIDWFDIKAIIRFGDYEVSFSDIRKYILNHQREFKLPSGEYAVIPDRWVDEYSDLFAFAKEGEDNLTLNKMHVSLVKDLKDSNNAKVAMTRKLEKLLDFDTIENVTLPAKFNGELRPYQQAGFNWLHFLNEYAFGGCLADDMGLGKTVQTLTLLQSEKEKDNGSTSLLIMPTSLIYNWEMEANKFTPDLKILNYTGTNRDKDPEKFARYDIVITSYGITRIDTDILQEFYFNYIILDESQAIKNPDSIISKSVRELKSRRKLILTGTPIENSTLDLWSQMSFVNPGLLGSQKFFKTEYQIPIEKKRDELRTKKLNALIKPFILRREKTQVAKDLPEKVENVRYCDLSEKQREYYDKERDNYRNKILDVIEHDGIQKSQMILLQGLTKLRQIANHPSMVDEGYDGDSGKFEDICHMISNALGKDHKLLIFSQFVKHLKIIEKYLKEEKINYSYLDGSVKDRKGEVEKFQNSDDVPVFLISLKAGGLGLNLTQADYVFLLDPWWNPAIEAQAVDRAHRIGQTNKVFTYKFIARDTVEEKILKLQQNKLQLAQDLITIEESFVKSLTKEDITKLFD